MEPARADPQKAEARAAAAPFRHSFQQCWSLSVSGGTVAAALRPSIRGFAATQDEGIS